MSPSSNPGFTSSFTLGGRPVGGAAPCLIIAEAGVAHFGDAGKARDLVDLAADAGCDVFKTQAYSTDALIAETSGEWRDRLRPKQVGFAFIAAMKARCDDRGLTFLCTAHDETVLPWLDDLAVPGFKVGSGERGNTPFLAEIARRGKPVILSTGMYTDAHVTDALAALAAGGCSDVALLHCNTSYPTPYGDVNLRAMDTLRGLFDGPVGYSDHTDGHHAPLAAVALGAKVIEKHITLDFNVPNAQDWKVSCGPHDLAAFVAAIRDVEAALGAGGKRVTDSEVKATEWALKSLVAVRPLATGTVLTAADLTAKRPGTGLPPSDLARVVGRTLAEPLERDAALTEAHLAPTP